MEEQQGLVRQSGAAVSGSDLRKYLKLYLRQEAEEEVLDWTELSTEDGLPHLWIYDLFLDSRGRVWIGTWGGGLALYEGRVTRTWSRRDGLHSDAVTSIREDREGRIWVATDGGLNRMRGLEVEDAGLYGKSILNMTFDRNGHLWVGCWRALRSGGGLFRFDGTKWRSYTTRDGLPGLEILKVFEDSRGRIWVGTYEGGAGAGVGCFDGTRWRTYTQNDGLLNDCVYSMFEDPSGNLWFGTVGGVSVLGTNGRWERITTMDGILDDRVYCMFIDSDRKMWFGTEAGVSRFDGETWRPFTQRDGLAENLVRAILEDRDGRMWFGTYPYAPGCGGISIACRRVDSHRIAERVQQYLPPGLQQNLLIEGDERGSGERRRGEQ
jgi:ligand-binding sensor domain-containing protein